MKHHSTPAKRLLCDELHAAEPEPDETEELPHFDWYLGQQEGDEPGYEVDAAGTYTDD